MRSGSSSRGLPALRATNRANLLVELRSGQALTRAELARATGLSATTVSSVLSELIATGLVTETDRYSRGPGGGRPGRLVRLASSRELVAAVDLGHDRIRVAVADLTGQILADDSLSADVDHGGADALELAVDRLQALIDRAEADTAGRDAGIARERISRLVIGVPGVIDPRSGTVLSGRMSSWAGICVPDELEKRTGWSTLVENDADLGALGEWTYGAARGLQDVVFVKVSAGIGAGLILGGQLYRASRGGAGELGHIQLLEDGAFCSCGNRGCMETIASVTVALAALRSVRPQVKTADDMAALAAAGDQAAVRVITDMGRSIGRAVADLCNLLAPQMLVIGGDLAGPPAPLIDAITAAVARYCQGPIARNVTVTPAVLGERSGLLGAVAASLAATENRATA